jgi:hypothetical protein
VPIEEEEEEEEEYIVQHVGNQYCSVSRHVRSLNENE